MSSKNKGHVKYISPEYKQFLWRGMKLVWSAQTQGQFAFGMKLISTLVNYLTEDIKEEYLARAKQIEATMNTIVRGNIRGVVGTSDVFYRHINKVKLLEQYASEQLNQFIIDLTNTLDEKGWMEKREIIETGYGRDYRDKNF